MFKSQPLTRYMAMLKTQHGTLSFKDSFGRDIPAIPKNVCGKYHIHNKDHKVGEWVISLPYKAKMVAAA